MEYEFKQSQIINNILQIVKQNKKEFVITDSKFPMDSNRIYKALQKLCKLWNTKQELREFVIELIDKFLPFNSSRRVDEFKSEKLAHDAILRDIELAGIDEIMYICQLYKYKQEQSAKLEKEQKARGDLESVDERIDNLREILLNQPYKILHADFGYFVPGYKKYLCRESVKALQIFVKYALEFNEPIISILMNNKKGKAQEIAINKKNKSIAGNISNAEALYSLIGDRTL